ncbi:MAG: prepilin-type N-terminal cleavage/methylation domain-containing protein [Candidatus Omnitrophica bacterium]|nr:prepilin-type N-terminal cleavage/methylation domain-containing protein [Candidatus Omnitrophota bacterium]MDD5436855.1 prepilin-type N-terminal cleavage/methylation domain-containing protein [Candidatus Omnitrophota bacterium]
MTTSRTGENKRAFTLVEVLVAVLILAVGMMGVIRAYITLANGIIASGFTVDASYLLKDKMADLEKEAIENLGLPPGSRGGVFADDYSHFSWKADTSDVMIESDKDKPESKKIKPKKLMKESLTQTAISVMTGGAKSARSLSLYTYLEKYTE